MKTALLLAALLTACCCIAQKDRPVSAFGSLGVNSTLYDRTISNNGVGFGAGMQVYIRTKSFIRPAIEATAEGYGGNKMLYVTADGKPIYAKEEVFTLFGGVYIQATRRLFFTGTGGPAFFNGRAYPAIKPAAGYYFLPGRQLAGRVSFTNVFQRDEVSSQSFGYLTFSVVAKLF